MTPSRRKLMTINQARLYFYGLGPVPWGEQSSCIEAPEKAITWDDPLEDREDLSGTILAALDPGLAEVMK